MNIDVPSDSTDREPLFHRRTGKRMPNFIWVRPMRYMIPGATAHQPE